MNDLTMRMFLRTTVCFKDVGVFRGKDKERMYGPNYSGNHVAIFECELKAPPQLSLIDHTYNMYIDAYRFNFKNWKLVDVDNYMDGNHFFSQIEEEKLWNEKVEKTLGGARAGVWMEGKTKSPLYNEEVLFPMVKEYIAKI